MSERNLQRFHVGPRLSEAAVFNGVVYLAGMVPERGDTDIRGQTADVLAQIDQRLADCRRSRERGLNDQVIHFAMGWSPRAAITPA